MATMSTTRRTLNLPLILGLVIVAISLVLAFAGPSLAPRNPLEETRVMQVEGGKFISAPFPPFTYPEYPLGTDGWGRDVLSQVLWALRPTLILTGYVAVLRLLIGTIIGLLAGWNNNTFGSLLNNLISAALSIPTLLVALAIIALTADFWQPWGFVLGLSLTGWADSARLVREQTRVARAQLFVEASRALGQGSWAIVFNHILRLVLPFVWMLLALEISSTILLTAGLGFLGYYVGGEVWVWISDTTATRLRGMPELGQLLSGVNEDIYVSPWKLFASGTFVFITVLGFNLLGEGLRRFANSGAPSPRIFDLTHRLRWQWDEYIYSPLKKWARAYPFAFIALTFGLVLALNGLANQIKALTASDVARTQSPGGHLWSSQSGSPAATMFVNAPGVESPRVEWAFSDAEGFSGGPAVAADGSVYILSKTGTLHSLNSDGSVKWSASIPANGVGTPGLDADGNIYVSDMLGALTSFTPTGEQRWRLEVPESLEATSGPVIGNNNIAYYVVIGNIRAVSTDGVLLWDTNAFSRRVPFTPVIDPDENLVFLRNTIIDASTGEVRTFEKLPTAEQYMVGQSGLLYLRFENKLTGWEIFNSEAEPRSYMEWSRTAFFGFPRLAGVFADGGMWLHYTTDIEDTTLLWLDKKGNQLNRAQFPYRPGFMGGMDEDFVSYLCGTRSDHIECAAVEKGADEPKWTIALEGAASVSGLALIPERLYVAAEDGILFAIGNE
jgi:peptide/nickel transport system permease protein